MSAVASSPPPAAPEKPKSTGAAKTTLLILGGVWIGGIVVLGLIYGFSGTRNNSFEPQNEFKLSQWVNIGLFSVNKAVLYLILASLATCITMIYVASRMKARPNKVQTAVEALYELMHDNIAGGNLSREMTARWFPFIGTLFLFIMFSNLIGYIPLPTNTEHYIHVLGFSFPAFSLYAATANLSIPLVLALMVFISYTYEGIRAKGPIGYLKGLVPGRRHGADGGLHLLPGGPVERHAADVALDSSLREHPRGPPDHPVHGGCARRDPRVRPGWAGSRSRSASCCSRSRSDWSRPCRRSSLPPSQLSTSAARSPKITKRSQSPCILLSSLS